MTEILRLKQRPQSDFLSQFKLERRALMLADKARGIPALRAGIDSNGHHVFIKIWPRDKGVDDSDLHEIWRNETRQLHRLAGYRGVSDYIAELRTSSFDDLGYYLVLSPGQRRPLELYLAENSRYVRPNPKSVNSRNLVWTNLLRVAKGLEILHLQGLLHRNLTTWAILTEYGEEPDFQLTGFEWSMRIVGQENLPKLKSNVVISEGRHSFVRDWQQLGQVAIELLEISASKIGNRAIASHDVAEHVTADEVRLIRELLQIFPTDRIDGRIVADQIETILTGLNAVKQNLDPAFHLVLPLGPYGPLAGAIREASGRLIETNDEVAQQQFIESDLSSPIAMAVKIGGQTDPFRLMIRGERLTYSLDDFKRGKEKTPSNWDLAYCASADSWAPVSSNIIKQIPMSAGALTFIRLADAGKTYRLRARVTPWKSLRQQLKESIDGSAPERLLRKSLVLTQMLDYLFAASDVFPVDVSEFTAAGDLEDEGRIRIAVRPRKDAGRDELSKALELKDPPATRLVQTLTGDQTRDDRPISWTLTDSPALGDRSETTTEWQFEEEKEDDNGERIYIFSGDSHPASAKELFLIPGESTGRDSQLRRRMKSFTALAEHRELSTMLFDPRNRILNSHDTVIADEGFKELDSSKQVAFKAAVETLPLFLIQGPPGVGKTRLVRELVRQILATDKSTRLLLSAQSNYAVDHLLREIEGILPLEGEGEALVVRCAPRERKDTETRFDIRRQTKSLLNSLLSSTLLSEASPTLRERTTQLAASYGLVVPTTSSANAPQSATAARRAIESLVLRAANLVFATTNSADLERLIDERSQFDWAIVEEAGKATGGELVSPLLLSPRRLMIGDHKQLPPFGAERTLKLLEAPNAVKRALTVGDPMIGRHFRDAIVEEVFNDIGPEMTPGVESGFPELCAEAIRNFSLFETMIESEYERQRRGGTGMPIAVPLSKQHRMHPAISAIVSHAFYKDELLTDEDCEARFRTQSSPVFSRDTARLPDSPVVWIDMPWVQKTSGMKLGERFPRYVNHEEKKAVETVLSLLRGRTDLNKKPLLAILSPYSRQVNALSRMVDAEIARKLKNLDEFGSASKQKNFCNTVDSFQGSEADCVVISLVRNNSHGSINAALGFLADPRRMNVLMSRAKWRLIIVGSLDFLRNINERAKHLHDQHQIEFLGRILSVIDSKRPGTEVSVVTAKTLLGGAS